MIFKILNLFLIISILFCPTQSFAQSSILNNNISQIHNPNEKWTSTYSNMPTSREWFGTVTLNGKIYCMGGRTANGITNILEVYNISTNTWETKTSMPTARTGVSAVAVDGKIYCIGGLYSDCLSAVEVYNPLTNTWEIKTDMPIARDSVGLVAVGKKIYVLAGSDTNSSSPTMVYDTEKDTWELKADIPTKRIAPAVSVIDNKIYCMGGTIDYSSSLNTVDIYDIATDTWSSGANMITPRRIAKAVPFKDKIYVVGGYNTSSLNSMEIYDIKTNTWTMSNITLSTSRWAQGMVIVNNVIYVIGGNSESLGYLNSIESYTIPYGEQAMNIDVYIKPQSILSVSLNTNYVSFEDFNGTEDTEYRNSIKIEIESNLPYVLRASLASEIQNNDKTKTMNKSILEIKESGSSSYNSFTGINIPILLYESLIPTTGLAEHWIDFKLKGGIPYEVDNYKTNIKFEIEQK